ncbi:MAG: PEGA domain-containing protein [Chlamydiales bacterium]|nr:PEGA domain-containing protein [Chlamydiales bacterium]
MKKTISLLLPCLTLLSSCATIMHGTRQSVGISSYPSDAHIWVDQQYVGKSPLIVDMTRKDNHYVRLEIDGYQPYEILFTRQLSGWVFGNIVFGGFIGLAIDAISGGIYRLTPEQVEVQMLAYPLYVKTNSQSYISIVMQADPAWEKIGQLQNF